MGTDKALIEIDDVPLLQRAIMTLSRISDDVAVIGDREEYRTFGARVVADAYPNAGTLGGIATAIECTRHQHVVVVACDMPLLSLPLLQAMVDEPRDYDVLVPVTAAERSNQGGRQTFETLHAIYSRACSDPIRQRLSRGELKVIGFFEDVRVRVLDEQWLRAIDPDLESLLNANDPNEFARIREIFDQRRAAGD